MIEDFCEKSKQKRLVIVPFSGLLIKDKNFVFLPAKQVSQSNCLVLIPREILLGNAIMQHADCLVHWKIHESYKKNHIKSPLNDRQ